MKDSTEEGNSDKTSEDFLTKMQSVKISLHVNFFPEKTNKNKSRIKILYFSIF